VCIYTYIHIVCVCVVISDGICEKCTTYRVYVHISHILKLTFAIVE